MADKKAKLGNQRKDAVRTNVSRFLDKAAELRLRLAGRDFTDSGELIADDRARQPSSEPPQRLPAAH